MFLEIQRRLSLAQLRKWVAGLFPDRNIPVGLKARTAPHGLVIEATIECSPGEAEEILVELS
jgi:hypothetical protein